MPSIPNIILNLKLKNVANAFNVGQLNVNSIFPKMISVRELVKPCKYTTRCACGVRCFGSGSGFSCCLRRQGVLLVAALPGSGAEAPTNL